MVDSLKYPHEITVTGFSQKDLYISTLWVLTSNAFMKWLIQQGLSQTESFFASRLYLNEKDWSEFSKNTKVIKQFGHFDRAEAEKLLSRFVRTRVIIHEVFDDEPAIDHTQERGVELAADLGLQR